jgi:hypothetical protein
VVTLSNRPADGEHHKHFLRSYQLLIALSDAQLGIWRQSCDQLANLLDDYSQELLSNLERFQKLGDRNGAEVIRGCCVHCLSHLAALCETICRVDPVFRTGMETLRASSLERLGELAKDMRMEEYTPHDLLLGVRLR